MSGEESTRAGQVSDEPVSSSDKTSPPTATTQRTRLAIALGASLLLAAIVGIVVATGGSDEAPSAPTGTCFEAWNEDAIAPIQDGQHAYADHGYRQTLVTRLDAQTAIIESPNDAAPADDPKARCAVIFASPQVDMEPDFGVRVFDDGRWTGLVLSDELSLEAIAELQADAVTVSNALLTAGGLLTDD
ncbi:MAG: hypothetical protein WKF62_05740 [Solirubrobacterales bacterium]